MKRNEKVANRIKEFAAEFLGRENNRASLITVTSCHVSPDLRRATVFITVYPIEVEEKALAEAKFLRSELRGFLDARLRGHSLTHVDFALGK